MICEEVLAWTIRDAWEERDSVQIYLIVVMPLSGHFNGPEEDNSGHLPLIFVGSSEIGEG